MTGLSMYRSSRHSLASCLGSMNYLCNLFNLYLQVTKIGRNDQIFIPNDATRFKKKKLKNEI